MILVEEVASKLVSVVASFAKVNVVCGMLVAGVRFV